MGCGRSPAPSPAPWLCLTVSRGSPERHRGRTRSVCGRERPRCPLPQRQSTPRGERRVHRRPLCTATHGQGGGLGQEAHIPACAPGKLPPSLTPRVLPRDPATPWNPRAHYAPLVCFPHSVPRHCSRSRSHLWLLLIPEPNWRHDRALLGDPGLWGLGERTQSLFFLQLPARRAAERSRKNTSLPPSPPTLDPQALPCSAQLHHCPGQQRARRQARVGPALRSERALPGDHLPVPRQHQVGNRRFWLAPEVALEVVVRGHD